MQQLDPLWDELFPAEQARIVTLLVERVDIGTNGLNFRLRMDGLGGLLVDDIPDRIQFADTLRRCREREVVSDEDVTDLRRMMALRNPLSHFRHVDDGSNLDRRSIDESRSADDLLRHDAIFSIGLAVRMLSRPAFRLG